MAFTRQEKGFVESRASMRRQVISWLEQAQLALLQQSKLNPDRSDFADGAHYVEMIRLTMEEKLGKPEFSFQTKDLGL